MLCKIEGFSIIFVPFDLSAVEKYSRVAPKPHNYVSTAREQLQRLLEMQAPRPQPKPLMQIWIPQMLQENEAQLWKPATWGAGKIAHLSSEREKYVAFKILSLA